MDTAENRASGSGGPVHKVHGLTKSDEETLKKVESASVATA